MTAEFVQPDLIPALPEMVMLAMTCLVLLVDLFLPQEKRGFTLLLSVATLALVIAAVIAVAPVGAVSSFGGSFVLDQDRLDEIYGDALPDREHRLYLEAVDEYGNAGEAKETEEVLVGA